jgi:hypothetical protein
LIIDWPTKDVPETLARAGWTVVVKGGPAPDAYSTYEVVGADVVARPDGRPPERVDLVYAHRPVSELPGIVALAQAMGARAVWLQSGLAPSGEKDPRGCWLPAAASEDARSTVEAAGLGYLDAPYIADAVRGAR